jgi:hypothetical protein
MIPAREDARSSGFPLAVFIVCRLNLQPVTVNLDVPPPFVSFALFVVLTARGRGDGENGRVKRELGMVSGRLSITPSLTITLKSPEFELRKARKTRKLVAGSEWSGNAWDFGFVSCLGILAFGLSTCR